MSVGTKVCSHFFWHNSRICPLQWRNNWDTNRFWHVPQTATPMLSLQIYSINYMKQGWTRESFIFSQSSKEAFQSGCFILTSKDKMKRGIEKIDSFIMHKASKSCAKHHLGNVTCRWTVLSSVSWFTPLAFMQMLPLENSCKIEIDIACISYFNCHPFI